MEEIKSIHKLLNQLEKRIVTIEEIKYEENINTLIEKVDIIEDFLIRRTRGFYLRDKRR
jgi:hypothetical protein